MSKRLLFKDFFFFLDLIVGGGGMNKCAQVPSEGATSPEARATCSCELPKLDAGNELLSYVQAEYAFKPLSSLSGHAVPF